MQRLQTRSQFQAVLAGATLSRTAHFALHCTPLPAVAQALPAAPADWQARPLFDGAGPWIGALLPKRWAKRAVTRNAIRRQVYAMSSEFEARLRPAAYVVRLRSGFDRSQFVSATSEVLKRAVRQELDQLFSRCAAPRAPAVVLTQAQP